MCFYDGIDNFEMLMVVCSMVILRNAMVSSFKHH